MPLDVAVDTVDTLCGHVDGLYGSEWLQGEWPAGDSD